MRRVVGDLMTKDVIVMRESTPYKEVVDLMLANDVSAVPVVDENGHLAGIVSEADLLLKEEHRGREAEHHRFERGRRRVERTKASGQVARDLMVTSVVSVRPDAAPGEAARLMHEHGVKRLPVIDEHGSVVGIVSRKDVLAIFSRPDEEIRNEVVHDMLRRKLWLTPEEADVRVSVERGIVTLDGRVQRKSMLEIIVSMTYGIEGVVGVNDHMHFVTDDTGLRPPQQLPWGVLPPSLRRP